LYKPHAENIPIDIPAPGKRLSRPANIAKLLEVSAAPPQCMLDCGDPARARDVPACVDRRGVGERRTALRDIDV
jgi:hypothetical protein